MIKKTKVSKSKIVPNPFVLVIMLFTYEGVNISDIYPVLPIGGSVWVNTNVNKVVLRVLEHVIQHNKVVLCLLELIMQPNKVVLRVVRSGTHHTT